MILLVTLPCCLAPLFDCTNTASFICNFTQVIQSWFAEHAPSQQNGMLVFHIEIYSTRDTELPVLRLNEVVLPVEYVEDL